MRALHEAFAAVTLSGGAMLAGALLVAFFTMRHGKRITLLVAANLIMVIMWILLLDSAEHATWRTQTLLQRAWELPVVLSLCALCVWEVRRLRPTEKRIRRALRAAPNLLLGAWLLALLGEQLWPPPRFDLYAPLPVGNFLFLAALSVPWKVYEALLCSLFARRALAGPPARVQNLTFAVAIAAFSLAGYSAIIGYGLQAFLSPAALARANPIQFAVEDALFWVWAPALLLSMFLAGSSAARNALREPRLVSLVSIREQFEATLWYLDSSGCLQDIARNLRTVREKARKRGLPEPDVERAVQTLKLTAILSSPVAPHPLRPETAARLLRLVDPPPAGPSHRPPAHPRDPDPVLTDAVAASLHLSGTPQPEPLDTTVRATPWYQIARDAWARPAPTSPTQPHTSPVRQTTERS